MVIIELLCFNRKGSSATPVYKQELYTVKRFVQGDYCILYIRQLYEK